MSDTSSSFDIKVDVDGLYGFKCTFSPDPDAPNACKFQSSGWPSRAMAFDRAKEHQQEHESGRMVAIWRAKVARKLDLYQSAREDSRDQAWVEYQDAVDVLTQYESALVLMSSLDDFKTTRGWKPWLTTQQYIDGQDN